MNVTMIAIVGPTASGKTDAAIDLAQAINGEIICADSRTVYKGFDIASAKPSLEQQALVPHHLLDVAQPDEVFTVADFKRLAEAAIMEIRTRGRVPIVVGGSGLYVDALLYHYSFTDKRSPRDDRNNRHAAVGNSGTRRPLGEGVVYVGINPGRNMIHDRLVARVDTMVAAGLVRELRVLREQFPGSRVLDAPGYRAFAAYLDGHATLDEAQEQFVIRDFQLARRQMTWFKRNPDITWYEDVPSLVGALTVLIVGE